jgi:hypothetical protein
LFAENFKDLTGSYSIFKNATLEGADHVLTSGGLFFAPSQSDVREPFLIYMYTCMHACVRGGLSFI